MKKKNFYIVRHYLNDECQFAVKLTKKQSQQYLQYFESINENMAGGLTHWFRIDIKTN